MFRLPWALVFFSPLSYIATSAIVGQRFSSPMLCLFALPQCRKDQYVPSSGTAGPIERRSTTLASTHTIFTPHSEMLRARTGALRLWKPPAKFFLLCECSREAYMQHPMVMVVFLKLAVSRPRSALLIEACR